MAGVRCTDCTDQGCEKCRDSTLTGTKSDVGKLRYELIPPYPLKELARAYTKGAQKYSDHNYLGGLYWSRVIGALMRHVEAWRAGEAFDPGEGLHHLASVAWCAFTLMMYEYFGLGEDDRWETRDIGKEYREV